MSRIKLHNAIFLGDYRILTDIKERFAIIRSNAGLNVKQFASSLDMAPTTVSSIESGTREPSKEVLISLATKYMVNLNWMLTGQGDPYSKPPGAGGGVAIPALAGIVTPGLPDLSNPAVRKFHSLPDKNDSIEAGPVSLPTRSASDLQDSGTFLIPILDQAVSAGRGAELQDDDEIVSLIPVPKALKKYGHNLAALPVRGDSMEPTIGNDDMVVCDTGGWDGDGIYVLRMDGGAYVKRLAKRPKGLSVISDNKVYESFDVDPEADGVAIVGRVRSIHRVLK